MKTSEKIDLLSTDYALAQTELKNASFDKINPHFKSKYATLAQVRDTTAPVLAKHGLAVIQVTDMIDGALVLVTRLVHKSGQWIEGVYPIAIGKPQDMGSALTYGRRYSLSGICGIASEEDDDGNEGQKAESQLIKPMPKAVSREPYEKISKGVDDIEKNGTREDLTSWYKTHVKTIEAFPTDWNSQIMSRFSEVGESLKVKMV